MDGWMDMEGGREGVCMSVCARDSARERERERERETSGLLAVPLHACDAVADKKK